MIWRSRAAARPQPYDFGPGHSVRKAITIATREMMIGMVLLVGALLWPMAPTLTDCIRQLQALQTMIGAIERRIMVQHRANEASKRIATFPGVRVIGASRAKPSYTEIQKQIGKGLKELQA